VSKKVKALEIEALRATFAGVKDYVVVQPDGPDAATDFNFRKNLRAKKIQAKVVKNSYAKKLFAEMGLAVEGVWAGPTLLCWGGANIKELAGTVDEQVKASKKDPKAPEKYKVKTAVADGQTVPLDVAKTLPTREEAIGDILSAVLGPGASLAGALTGPATEIAGILKAIEEKSPAEAETPAAAG
jgi:ribosomal protein L10